MLATRFLRDFVRAERDRGKAVIFSTHYLAEAELLCDRIGLLHRGPLLAEGTPAGAARGRRRREPAWRRRSCAGRAGAADSQRRRRMSACATWLVAGKELRETLRDRRTLAVMVLFPLVVYPLVSLLTGAGDGARISAPKNARTRRAWRSAGPPALADKLRARLAARDHAGSDDFALSTPAASAADVARRPARRRDRRCEQPGARGPARRHRRAPSLYDETRERSRTGARRASTRRSRRRAARRAARPATPSAIAASRRGTKVGGYLLSKILPLVVVVMVMLGAFYPAIDITAGERERGTLETIAVGAGRRASTLMTGKVLAVATLAALTGMLNLASMSLTVLEGVAARGAARDDAAHPVDPHARPRCWSIPPAAFLFASVMVAIGALARSFKEAQTLLTPVYFLCMAPALMAGARRLPADRRRGCSFPASA